MYHLKPTRDYRRGSFTVELACLMPLYLLVIFGSIYLCFYVHNRAWLTAAAHESALVGTMEAVKYNGDSRGATLTRGQTRLSQGLLGGWDCQVQVSADSEKIKVQYDQNTRSAYGGILGHLQVQAEEKITDPVAHIWKVKGLEGIVDAVRRKE